MADMKKLKEDAIRRKMEHEEIERKKALASMSGSGGGKRPAQPTRRKPTGTNRNTGRGSVVASAKASRPVPKGRSSQGKPKVRNWTIDILLALAGLMAVVFFVAQVI